VIPESMFFMDQLLELSVEWMEVFFIIIVSKRLNLYEPETFKMFKTYIALDLERNRKSVIVIHLIPNWY